MPYRDDLDAARQELLTLQNQLAKSERQAARQTEELQGRHQAQVAELRKHIAALEAQLGRSRELGRAGIWLICWSPALAQILVQVGAMLLAGNDQDATAWFLCQVGLVFSVLVTVLSWWRRGLVVAWIGSAALKVTMLVAWGWGWWSPFYSEIGRTSALKTAVTSSGPSLSNTALAFFWGAPLVMTVILIVEGVWIRRGLRPRGQTTRDRSSG